MAVYDKETKFYWLQLKEDFFEDDAIQWLEEQKPNGRDYAYFYLKLCLKSLKSNGVLIRKVGNILIPYDNKKLAELTKMDFDTVTVAMELLKQIGLIQVLDQGQIYITQLDNLIGSVSKGALKKQQQRLLSGQKGDKCPPKIKIEIKDKDKDRNRKVFKKPTIEEINKYCLERNNGINAEAFYDFYESKDWYVGKNRMKDWKACVRTWERRNESKEEKLPSWWNDNEKELSNTNNELEELISKYE
jgi:predicted phage replisome organizer